MKRLVTYAERIRKLRNTLTDHYPHLPYLVHLEFRMIPLAEEFERQSAALKAYLKKYPDSPHREEALFRLGKVESDPGGSKGYFEELLKNHPDSPYVGHVQALLNDPDLQYSALAEKTVRIVVVVVVLFCALGAAGLVYFLRKRKRKPDAGEARTKSE